MTVLFQVRTAVPSCLARTYRTTAQSTRTYGPSPSDISPVPRVIPKPIERVVTRRDGRNSGWTEEKRQRHRTLYPPGEHPTLKWAQNNPEQYAEVVKKRIAKARAWHESMMEKKLLNIIQSPQTIRMQLYSKKFLHYRLTLFADAIYIRLEGDLAEKKHSMANMLVSFSPHGTTHPYAARHQPSHVNIHREQFEDKRLNQIGVRLSGLHPKTKKPYVLWIPVGDKLLKRALKIYDRINDQELLEALCKEGYDKYVNNPKEEDMPTD